MDKLITYLFFLSLALVALAYYTGLKTDAGALFSGANGLVQTVTGRNSSGAFAAYPGGA